MKVLIVGGYGVFGGRLARMLRGEPGLTLLIAGRSRRKAERFIQGLDPRQNAEAVRLEPLVLDRRTISAGQLAGIGAALVVDCTGPFQAYGDAPYRLATACIEAGVDYLDLADGTAFVAGIAGLDAAARAAGVAVISGASTCPALTGAVVRALTPGWRAVHAISAGIAPSPFADVGLTVIQAIASYAGRPVRLLREGGTVEIGGLCETRRADMLPPGGPGLRRVLFSAVDTPDLVELPRLWPELRSVWFGAGPRPELLHGLLVGLARLIRAGVPIPLLALAPLIHAVKVRLAWGADRGGMFVEARGLGPDGAPAAARWALIAEGNDGPNIPAMAAAALVVRKAKGGRLDPGARSAVGDLALADFQPWFERFSIRSGRDQS